MKWNELVGRQKLAMVEVMSADTKLSSDLPPGLERKLQTALG